MGSRKTSIKDFLLEILFPSFCFGCQKEGTYLCEDCIATLEISQYQYCLCQKPIRLPISGKCSRCAYKKLNGLYSALPYQNPLVKDLIQKFKYEPFVRDLAGSLALLVTNHLELVEPRPDFSNFFLVPIPLAPKRLRWRGFNQAEELTKELASSLEIPVLTGLLIKTKESSPQVDLPEIEREENVRNIFSCKNPERAQGKKLLLVDDVYTTGTTMEEASRILKQAGAKEVWGVTVARG